MPPQGGDIDRPTGVLFEDDTLDPLDESNQQKQSIELPYRRQIVWLNILIFSYFHIAAGYGAYLIFTSAKLSTILFAVIFGEMCTFGITAGAHRLWAHRAYKANLPLRVLLMLFNTVCYQTSIYFWVREHRVHHKFSETDADPHNAKRGVFFSHIGWLLVRKHPQVLIKGRTIDLSDLEQDAVVMFQKKYYYLLTLIFFAILPNVIPMYFWGETLNNAWHVAMFRYVWRLHVTFLVNSAAHCWGNKPYDKNIYAAQNLGVSIATLGEGWHNYHHVFPWDYTTSELGNYRVNFTTAFIDFFAKIGWAYDLKTIPRDVIKRRAERTGDSTHEIWGWGDTSMSKETANNTRIELKKYK